MEFIQAPGLPAPAGHYSQAVVTRGGLVFVSGVLPARDLGELSFEAQCASVFDQCAQILAAAGCTLADVVQCTAYLAGVEHWPAFNAAYAGVFGEHRPARAVVPVPALHYDFLVEVQLVAERPNG
ncbi:RidA family protein [Massilia sp. G4R7]|uniref:RidA family protein n=1 Tax=Massilia phyllostachyos TaxID=2898585 RepID=A0ABS8QA51_9BURK|nr:RidA family protein [Massilia phyllostachyos]MCD2518636.1 RidA family protein [Massilia phyllostachyos]